MDFIRPGSFPNPDYLRRRTRKMLDVFIANHSAEEGFAVAADALLQWQGAYVTDLSMEWTLEQLTIDDLYLTGMNPDWNAIIIDRCERSPQKLRLLFDTDAEVRAKMVGIKADEEPIMVRAERGKLAVMDGMNRVVFALTRRDSTITAFVGRRHGSPQLQSPAGIAYTFCRAYRMGRLDEDGLVTVLRIMRTMYVNLDVLLRKRYTWEPDLVPLLKRALDEPYHPSLKERLRLALKRWLF